MIGGQHNINPRCQHDQAHIAFGKPFLLPHSIIRGVHLHLTINGIGRSIAGDVAGCIINRLCQRRYDLPIEIDPAENPVDAIEAIRSNSDGYHCWTEAEIAQFDAKWPLGTRERLAKELLLYTALRRSDIVKIGRQHRTGDKLILRHSKNKSDTVIRILPPLADALDTIEAEHLTYLVTAFGKPFSAAGFGNWFGDRCRMAGLPHCSAHGLRKAMARRLAEAGVSMMEGRAVTGHKSDAMFSHYAASASREQMAERALHLVSERFPMANQNGNAK